jgi:hypothetical protein
LGTWHIACSPALIGYLAHRLLTCTDWVPGTSPAHLHWLEYLGVPRADLYCAEVGSPSAQLNSSTESPEWTQFHTEPSLFWNIPNQAPYSRYSPPYCISNLKQHEEIFGKMVVLFVQEANLRSDSCVLF